MKVIAFARFENSKRYLSDESGKDKEFWIYDALRMRRNDRSLYDTIEFVSWRYDRNNREVMVPVETGFYRYKPGYVERDYGDRDRDLVTHTVAIAVLAQMKTITFIIEGRSVEFEFSRMDAEVESLFPDGGRYRSDLYGHFTDVNKYSGRWGGRVAIEVCVTHKCEDQKARSFERHGIPVIEITITDKWHFKNGVRLGEAPEEELEKYKQKTEERFSGGLYAKVISNPVALTHHNKQISSALNQRDESVEMLNAERQISDGLRLEIIKHLESVEGLSGQVEQWKGRAGEANATVNKAREVIRAQQEKISSLTAERDLLVSKTFRGCWTSFVDAILRKRKG